MDKIDTSTARLEAILEKACPAMDDLKRIDAESYSIDFPGTGAWTWVGKHDNAPSLATFQRGWSSAGDAQQDAIEAMCIMAPALAREVLALRAALREIRALSGGPILAISEAALEEVEHG